MENQNFWGFLATPNRQKIIDILTDYEVERSLLQSLIHISLADSFGGFGKGAEFGIPPSLEVLTHNRFIDKEIVPGLSQKADIRFMPVKSEDIKHFFPHTRHVPSYQWSLF
ncbi:MAG: hypothetical protein HZA03_01700 [Nitrospinae bacterium]|nr:hypothetical protein [Nitrospinota bacterium]